MNAVNGNAAQVQLDTDALRLAAAADAKADMMIAGHTALRDDMERLRSENRDQHKQGRTEIRDGLLRLHGRIDELQRDFAGRQLRVAAALITILLGIAGYLTVHGAPWN